MFQNYIQLGPRAREARRRAALRPMSFEDVGAMSRERFGTLLCSNLQGVQHLLRCDGRYVCWHNTKMFQVQRGLGVSQDTQ